MPGCPSQDRPKNSTVCDFMIEVSHIRPRLPRSGESSGGGFSPHHWRFSHPAFSAAGLRVTEVPFLKYRRIELFSCQGSAESGSPCGGCHLENCLLFGRHREGSIHSIEIKLFQKISDSLDFDADSRL